MISDCVNFKFNLSINDSHLSDHQEIFLSFRDTSNKTTNFSDIESSFVTKNLNVVNFRRLLSRELSLYTPKNLPALLHLIENTKRRCITTRTIFKRTNPNKKWVNTELLEIIAERNRYHKLFKKFPTNIYIKNKYTEYRNMAKSMNNQARRIYNSNELNKYISKPRQLWKCFNEIIHNKPNTPNDIKSIAIADGSVSYDPTVISNTINDYFCNIGRELSLKIPHTEPSLSTLIPNNPRTMALFPVTPGELQKIICDTKPNSNLNNILPINYMKQCLDILADPLSSPINHCFEHGSFPNIIKSARIVPIFKSGDCLYPENYRPISILDDFSKIIEQCIFDRLSNFVHKFNLISNSQFGFQKQSGTLSAAVCLLDHIRSLLDASIRNICAAIFIDITKAFDSICHDLLLQKLYRIGIRSRTYDLIRSFLSNRTQYTSTSKANSNSSNIDFGTPQGSTLGPALFILFINDITNLKLHGKIILFADDAVIVYCGTDIERINEMMIEDLETISRWFEENKLTLNMKKTKCMAIHPQQHLKKYSLNIHLNGTHIEQVTSFEYLGLTLQENIRWDLQIEKIAKKINRISGVIHRIGNSVNTNTLTSIYYAHIHSHLTYMSPIWGHSVPDALLRSIQTAQNNAIRSIFRREYYALGLSTNQIRKNFKIFDVRQIVKYETAMLAYKINNKRIKTDINTIAMNSRHNYRTRNSSQLYQCSFRTNIGRYKIARLIAVEWNVLPTELRNLLSLNLFKKKLKEFYLMQ